MEWWEEASEAKLALLGESWTSWQASVQGSLTDMSKCCEHHDMSLTGSVAVLFLFEFRYQKLLEIEKEIVREVARGDKPSQRKSTDRKAQISPLNWTNAFLICALRSVDFLR